VEELGTGALKRIRSLLFGVFISFHFYPAEKGGEIDGEEEESSEEGQEGCSEEKEESLEEEKINVSW